MERLTQHEFNLRSEEINQEIRGYDLAILETKRDIKSNQLEASKYDLEKSKEDIRRARLGYESAKVANDITEQKLEQLQDQLSYERAMVFLNKQSLVTQGKSALLSLQQAQIELENNSELFELKYRTTVSLESLPME